LVIGFLVVFQSTNTVMALTKVERDRHIVEVSKDMSPTFEDCPQTFSSLDAYGLACGVSVTTPSRFMTTWSTNATLRSKVTTTASIASDWKTDTDGYSTANFRTSDNDPYIVLVVQRSTQVSFVVDWLYKASDGDTAKFSNLPQTFASFNLGSSPLTTTPNISSLPINSTSNLTGKIPQITDTPTPTLGFGLGLSFVSAFSPDGSTYVTLSDPSQLTYDLRIWDSTTGVEIKSVFAGNKSSGSGLAFSRDGSALFTVLDNQPIRIWDTRTWRVIAELPNPESGYISDLQLNPKTSELCIVSKSAAYLLNANTGKIKAKIAGLFSSSEYSPDGSMLALGTTGTSSTTAAPIRILKTDTLTDILTIPSGVQGYSEVTWNPSGNQVAVKTWIKTASNLKVYDLKGQQVFVFDSPVSLSGKARWSPDGTVIAVAATYDASADKNERVFFLNSQNGQLVAQALVEGFGSLSVVFSPNGKLLGTSMYIVRTPEGVTATVNQILGKQSQGSKTATDQLAKLEPLCDSGQLTFAECTLARRAIEAQYFAEVPALLRFLNGEISLEEFIRLLRK
jgi:hypothetical protein